MTFGKYNIEIQLLKNWYWISFKGHEVVANYIEYYNYWLCFGLIIRKVGLDRSNVFKFKGKND